MLIDNKKDRYDDGLNIVTVWDFIKMYAAVPLQQDKFDIVTGYFTLRALSKLYNDIPEEIEYRLLSSELLKEANDEKNVIDLLRGDEGIGTTFELEEYVRDAKAFLKRDTVSCKAITNAFCHAKVYLYEPTDNRLKGFFLSGSSNLTDSDSDFDPPPISNLPWERPQTDRMQITVNSPIGLMKFGPLPLIHYQLTEKSPRVNASQ